MTTSTLRAAGLHAKAPCHLPVPPLVLASLAGHLHRWKSQGEKEEGRWSEASSGPACQVRWEATAGHRGQGGDVEERLSKRGGLGSYPSPQSAWGRVSS